MDKPSSLYVVTISDMERKKVYFLCHYYVKDQGLDSKNTFRKSYEQFLGGGALA
jgi:hypothetical protein